jgi:hypothetical protein
MPEQEKSAVPELLLDIGEKLQFLGGVLSAPITGSSSSSYQRFIYHKQPDIHPSEIQPVLSIPGDSETDHWSRQIIPRRWPNIAVIGTLWEELADVYVENRSHRLQQAVVYISEDSVNGSVRMGMSRDEKDYMFGRLQKHENYAAIGLRLGKGALHATMGLWDSDDRHLFVPPSTSVLIPKMPIKLIDNHSLSSFKFG